MISDVLREALDTPLAALSSRELIPIEVAVIDSGVDATHPDLVGRVSDAFQTRLEDGRGEVVAVPQDTNNDTYGHGTAVAGIITAIAPNARIVDVRVLGDRNLGAGLALVAGLQSVLLRDTPLINMSLAASSEFSPALNRLCERAYRRQRVVVASKRNMPLQDDGFPAEFSSCISVDNNTFPNPPFDLRFRARNAIEFAAHGVDVRVPAPGGGHTTKTGTSFATPTVTGICALLLGAFPSLVPFEVKTVLKAHAVRGGAA